jgi:hypothetical protein
LGNVHQQSKANEGGGLPWLYGCTEAVGYKDITLERRGQKIFKNCVYNLSKAL